MSKGHSRKKVYVSFRVLVKKCKYTGGFSDSNSPIYSEGKDRRMPVSCLTPAVGTDLWFLRTFLPAYSCTGALTIGLGLAFIF